MCCGSTVGTRHGSGCWGQNTPGPLARAGLRWGRQTLNTRIHERMNVWFQEGWCQEETKRQSQKALGQGGGGVGGVLAPGMREVASDRDGNGGGSKSRENLGKVLPAEGTAGQGPEAGVAWTVPGGGGRPCGWRGGDAGTRPGGGGWPRRSL